MKKSILILTIIFFFILKSGISQEKPFIFGIKIAPNIGWMNPDSKNYENKGSDVGFSWGFLAEFHLMENYVINSGFNISYVNATLEYTEAVGGESGVLNRGYRLKYVEIPLTLKMKTKDFDGISYFGMIGFGAGFRLSAKANDKFVPDGGAQVSDENDISDDIKSVRASLIMGVGLEYAMGGDTKLLTGLNFNNGINDILSNQNNADPTINHKAINNYFELYFAVLF